MPTSQYAVHPAVAYCQTIIDNIPAKTGRSVEQWVRLINKHAPDDAKSRKAWLKTEHDLGGTTASLLLSIAAGESRENIEADAYLRAAHHYVEAMYAGNKAHLRPIHDRLLKLGRSLGNDVRVCPCRTIVPLYRTHVFAEIKPATQKRIDLGLALRDYRKKLPAKIIPTGGLEKKDRITHRIPIESTECIDADIERWLKIAYDLDAPGAPG